MANANQFLRSELLLCVKLSPSRVQCTVHSHQYWHERATRSAQAVMSYIYVAVDLARILLVLRYRTIYSSYYCDFRLRCPKRRAREEEPVLVHVRQPAHRYVNLPSTGTGTPTFQSTGTAVGSY